MKVMIDTNVIISAALFPNGRVSKAYFKALMPPYHPIVCDYVVDELHRKFREKWPNRLIQLEAFLYESLSFIELVPTPEVAMPQESLLRDVKDRPILRAAIASDADIILTGDLDFLESSIVHPRILNPAGFLDLC